MASLVCCFKESILIRIEELVDQTDKKIFSKQQSSIRRIEDGGNAG
jgi:hypothetical protein